MSFWFILCLVTLLFNIYYFYKLLKRLYAEHKEKYEELDLVEPPWVIFIAFHPIDAINLLRFIYSRDYLGDSKLRYFKRVYKITFLILIATFVLAIVSFLL